MADGIPIRAAVLGATLALAAIAIGIALYYRSLAGGVLAEAPIAVRAVAPDAAALAAAAERVEAARARRAAVELSEEDVNRLLFDEALRARGGAVRLALAEPYVRIALSEPVSGRWLNAELLAVIYAGPSGLGFEILAGKVGKVSISKTEGEWVRGKIERQLAAEMAANPRVARLFAGARAAKVAGGKLVVEF